MNKQHKKCFTCLHAGETFKVNKKPHCHCQHHKWDELNKVEPVEPWDTLCFIFETCDNWESKKGLM